MAEIIIKVAWIKELGDDALVFMPETAWPFFWRKRLVPYLGSDRNWTRVRIFENAEGYDIVVDSRHKLADPEAIETLRDIWRRAKWGRDTGRGNIGPLPRAT